MATSTHGVEDRSPRVGVDDTVGSSNEGSQNVDQGVGDDLINSMNGLFKNINTRRSLQFPSLPMSHKSKCDDGGVDQNPEGLTEEELLEDTQLDLELDPGSEYSDLSDAELQFEDHEGFELSSGEKKRKRREFKRKMKESMYNKKSAEKQFEVSGKRKRSPILNNEKHIKNNDKSKCLKKDNTKSAYKNTAAGGRSGKK